MDASMNIGNLIKRLNLIKGLILLDEFDDLPSHIQKLRGISEDSAVKEIINDIDSKFYSEAVAKIEKFINENQKVILFQDPEIEALRIEIKKLEVEFTLTSD